MVQGHEGIPGTKEVDHLAKEAVKADFVGLEPFFGVSRTYIECNIIEALRTRREDQALD